MRLGDTGCYLQIGKEETVPQKLEVPRFADEAEEARWWFENRDLLSDEFELAAKEGRLGHGRAVSRALAARELLQIDSEDAQRGRRQAASHGMEYPDYLKMILHQALLTHEKSA